MGGSDGAGMTERNQQTIVSREATQAKLDRRSVVAQRYLASQTECTAELFEATVRKHPDGRALIYGDTTLSYAELNRRVNQTAHALHGLGVKRGDVVGLCIENRPAFLYAWFGLAKLGAVAAFLNTNVGGKPLAHALTVTGASRVIVGEECLGLFANLEGAAASATLWLWADPERQATPEQRAACNEDLETLIDAAPDTDPPAEWRAGTVAGDPAIYIFTSGTTGLPKAAKMSHARWLMSGGVQEVTTGLTADDCFYIFLPLYHGAAAQSGVATLLAAGAAMLLRRKFSRSEFWNDVRRHRVTACQYVGEICRFLLTVPERGDDREHSLRILVGAGMSPEIWREWVRRFGEMNIFEGWGATEANANVINVDNRIGSCGRVPDWNKTNLRLVRFDPDTGTYPRDANGHLQVVGVDEPGEAIGMIYDIPDIMAGRFEGYTSKEATEKKILRNAFADGDAWWASGDMLRCDADGYCWFVDRIGDTYRWNSENVSTAEVTDQLGDFPGMDALTIYGVKVEGAEGRAGMAAVVMQDGHAFDPAAFWAFALERLPRYAAPLFVRLPKAADMTGNYKLRKVDLQRDGYDAAKITDPLYVRDDKLKTYVPLTPQSLQEALSA